MDALWDELGTFDSAIIVPATLRLIVASILAALIGWERERGGHSAGLRTHILVGLGSALFSVVPVLSSDQPDLAAVVKGVAAGVGFLGGGAILKDVERQSVEGLTTAASIWLTAAVGLAAAAGMYTGAFIATFIALFVLRPLGKVAHEINQDDDKTGT